MPKPSERWTFHKIRRECERGSREAWRAFLSGYTPIVFQLLDVYAPSPSEQRRKLWPEALLALSANNFEQLRPLSRQAELEFLVDLRALILEQAAAMPGVAPNGPQGPRPTPEKLRTLLEGLPLLHQEIVFLKLAGYSDTTLEKLLRVTPSVARKALERLSADYSALLEQGRDNSPWPADWLAVLRQARAAKNEKCPPLHHFVLIFDGQISWYEKEPVEQHVAGCLHCLERWIALREVRHWRLEAKPVSSAELDELLSCLPVESATSAKKSLLRRVFG